MLAGSFGPGRGFWPQFGHNGPKNGTKKGACIIASSCQVRNSGGTFRHLFATGVKIGPGVRLGAPWRMRRIIRSVETTSEPHASSICMHSIYVPFRVRCFLVLAKFDDDSITEPHRT